MHLIRRLLCFRRSSYIPCYCKTNKNLIYLGVNWKSKIFSQIFFSLFILFKLLKFGIIFFIVNLMSYTSEAFPTVLRSQGQGICMIVGSIGKINTHNWHSNILIISTKLFLFHFHLLGSTLAPLVKLTDLNPLMILTGLGVFGYLLCLKLDENDGMRDYLERDNLNLPVTKKPEANVNIQLTPVKFAWGKKKKYSEFSS